MPNDLVQELRKNLRGEILDSSEDRKKYSTDESIFEVAPRVVVAPESEADLAEVVGIATHHGVPITARGAGSSTAGQAIGEGIILDFTKHFTKILDVSGEYVRVQPGVVLDFLNEHLRKKGRRFAVNPSSKAYCTVGGMVGNNASGPHTFRYGDTRRYVLNLKGVLHDGSVVETAGLGERFASLAQHVRAEEAKVRADVPRTRKNSSGYFLEALLGDSPDFTELWVGAEGTLGLISEIELETVPLPAKSSTVVVGFPTLSDAVAAVSEYRTLEPLAIELADRYVLDALSGADAVQVAELGLDCAQASLWMEWEGEVPDRLRSDRRATVLTDPKDQARAWALRSEASKFLQRQPGPRRPLRCIEDGVVPVEELPTYIDRLRQILLAHGADGAIFGHAGDAHIHVNPGIDVEKPKLMERIEQLMEEAHALIFSMGGSISGEHGDGLLRRDFLHRQWPGRMALFGAVKEAFDPKGIFNRGKKLPVRGGLPASIRSFMSIPRCS